MESNTPFNAYQESIIDANINVASPLKQLQLLYQGLFHSLIRMKAHIQHQRIQDKTREANRCMEILSTLDSALDPDENPEVAESLHQLYLFCMRQLMEANLRNKTELVDEVMSSLAPVKQAWEQLSP
ncbi:flagellar export chaperone FliS [Dongshaea marina]|uniref:flagellar export chaperone FliS n=1 Tax=Dongshaea marina TaxID=2047966 RepID=UPI000D3E146B|nr:flagellar export chaperone FliS [Dongshaea marina]